MRHTGCGGLAGEAELLTGIEGASSRPVAGSCSAMGRQQPSCAGPGVLTECKLDAKNLCTRDGEKYLP